MFDTYSLYVHKYIYFAYIIIIKEASPISPYYTTYHM